MPRSSEPALVVFLGLAAAALAAPGKGPAPAAPTLGKLTYVERQVEQAGDAGAWSPVKEGAPLRIGSRVRTGTDGVARLELPWMAVTVGPSAAVSFPDDDLLSAVLEQGRLGLIAETRDILKVVTGEAEVRGRGRAVVRREGQRTLVTALAGRFTVEGAGKVVVLGPGKGTVVADKQAPTAAADAPEPPQALKPGTDPLYTIPGTPVSLQAAAKRAQNQIEVLPVGSEVVLLQRDVGAPPWRIDIPWPGAFRWRVSARDRRGLEGTPSADGLIAVDRP